MTEEELDRLASLIADALLAGRESRTRGTARGGDASSSTWLPLPVRPEPPARSAEPPLWSGAAQRLGDVAPGREEAPPRHREPIGDLISAARAAAAGRNSSPASTFSHGRATFASRPRARGAPPIEVRIGISNRHVHLSPEHVLALFGAPGLTARNAISQPGQFAANETVAVVAPSGRIDAVRVVGPARVETQLELALSDAARLGIAPPLAASGVLATSAGGVSLVGPVGRVDLARGVIIAARHLHLAPADATRWGLRDGDLLDVRCGEGARAVTMHDVLVRSGSAHATELHLDADEARAAGVKPGSVATIIAWRSAKERRRPVITERDVVALARAGESIPRGAILTPSARDRARALGVREG